MDTNFSLFNQINSLSYWLLNHSEYRTSVVLDAENDIYSLSVKKAGIELFANCIKGFSKRNPKFLEPELDMMVASLLNIKQRVSKTS